jgi:Flp pilus assembly protein TadG
MRRSRERAFRSGIACVEFAVTAPVLVLITFMIIDVCNVIHLKQKINTVAFETARIASLNRSSFEGARLEGLQFAQARNLQNVTIRVESFEPTRFPTRESLPLGFTLRAQVTVTVQDNVPGPFVLFRGTSISSQLVRLSAR